MYKKLKRPQAIRRQREIEDALLNMMLKVNFYDIKIVDLCKKIDLPRKSFYRYFQSKEDTLQSLIHHKFEDCKEHIFNSQIDTLEDLEKLYIKVCEFWISNKDFLDAFRKSDMSYILIKEAIFSSNVSNCKDTLNIMPSIFIISGIMNYIILWHYKGFKESPKQIAKHLVLLTTNPIIDIK